ncbi:MAG: hypothetical protein JSS79_14560 [Bacteroidetes bacterium]|nr:hypothetical protein [Bacteroidota bacterium]
MKAAKWIVGMVIFGISAIALLVWITMSLWNWLVPELFHGPAITYWQTLGLLILSKIFFWTFGKKHHGHRGGWRPYWKEKWTSMSPEEKERFKQKMKDKWCYREEPTSPKDSGTSNG